jgi:hypothetical protein
MGSEASLWQRVRQACSFYHCDLTRIENTVEKGTPDVNGCYAGVDFWVELKYRERFPVRDTTPVTLSRYTNEQRAWLRNRGMCGGKAWLLVQVGDTYYLFNWLYAQRCHEVGSKAFKRRADFVWHKSLNGKELLRALTRGGLCIFR